MLRACARIFAFRTYWTWPKITFLHRIVNKYKLRQHYFLRCVKCKLLCEFPLQILQTQFENGRNFKLLILRQLQSRSSHQRRRISVPPRILFGDPARENLYCTQKTAKKINPFPFELRSKHGCKGAGASAPNIPPPSVSGNRNSCQKIGRFTHSEIR